MCLIGGKETYVQKKKKVTKNILSKICTTVSGLKILSPWEMQVTVPLGKLGVMVALHRGNT